MFRFHYNYWTQIFIMKFPFKIIVISSFNSFKNLYLRNFIYRYLKFNVQGWKKSIHKIKDNYNLYHTNCCIHMPHININKICLLYRHTRIWPYQWKKKCKWNNRQAISIQLKEGWRRLQKWDISYLGMNLLYGWRELVLIKLIDIRRKIEFCCSPKLYT